MAEGLLRAIGPDCFEVASAGLEAGSLRPEAVAVMREIGIDISTQLSKSVDVYAGQPFDIPAAVDGDETERLSAFRDVRDGLRSRIADLAGAEQLRTV